MKKTIIIFILTFTSILDCFAQSDINKIANVTFEKDGIKFSFYINKTIVSSKDTLETEIDILNESDNSIFVVPTFHFTYVVDSISKIPNSIYLDFGGSIEDYIVAVPFIEIEKNKNFSVKKNFHCSNFSYDGFAKEIYFQLWFGYLRPRPFEKFEEPKISDGYLYFDQSNIKFFEKGLLSLAKVIHHQ